MAIFSIAGAAIAGAIGLAGTAATIVGGLIGGALAFGAQALLGQFINRPKKRTYSAVQGEVQIGGNIPAQAIYGKAKTRGHRVYYAKWGSGNKINAEVFVLSNGWCDGLEEYVYFEGKKHNLVELTAEGTALQRFTVEGYENRLNIRFYDGRPGQVADGGLATNTADLGTPWKSTSTLTGHCYVVVTRVYNSDVFENGAPEIEFVLRGLREYDPRKDSTVAGGSGSHRVDDPATWEWTENPALHRLNYQLGLRGLISNRTIIGEGKTLGQLDLGTYFAAMNVCDTLKDGKPTYAASLIVNADDDHTEVLKEFDDAMAGYGLNRRGLSGVIAGAPQIPVAEITADDIPQDRAKDIRRRKSAFELYNHLSGQFTSIEDQWNPASLKPITVNADVAADGRSRQTSNDFLQVTDPDIAQYLLTIRYRQQRLGGRVTLPVSRRIGLAVSEGQWVTYDGTDWLVQRWNVSEDFLFTLELAETSADIYDDSEIQPGPIVVPSTPPINPSELSNVQNFAVEVGTVTGADGSEVPALRFTWTPPDDPSMVEVRFEYGPGTKAPLQPFRDTCFDPEAGEYTTTKNVSSAQFYTARCTIRTVPDRFKTFSQWITTAQATGPFDIYAEIDLDQLAGDVTASLEWISGGLREVQNAFAEVAQYVADQDWQNHGEVRTLYREISVTREEITAAYEELITTAVSEIDGQINAVSQRVETLEVEIDGKAGVSITDALDARVEQTEGGITVLGQAQQNIESALSGYLGTDAVANAFIAQSARITATEEDIQANATAIQGVEAQVGAVSASGAIKFEAAASPGDGWSRIGLYASANDGTTFEEAAIFLDARTTGEPGSRVAVVADQFVITDGAAESSPFVFQDGALVVDGIIANWANISSIVTGNFVADTGNIGDLTVTTIKIEDNAISRHFSVDGGQKNIGYPLYQELCRVTVTANPGDVVVVHCTGTSDEITEPGYVEYRIRELNSGNSLKAIRGHDFIIRGSSAAADPDYRFTMLSKTEQIAITNTATICLDARLTGSNNFDVYNTLHNRSSMFVTVYRK